MPIKFRCNQCGQFLGISRSKAGELVDCPTCGRTVRVPRLDGRVEPLPQPALNLEDSALSQALDELAMIGQNPSENVESLSDERQAPPQQADVIELTPLPEAVPVEPSLPASPGAQPQAPPRAAEKELAMLAASSPAGFPSTSPARTSELQSWWSLFPPTVVLTIGVIAAVMFAAGFLAGRMGNSGNVADVAPTNGEARTHGEGNLADGNGTQKPASHSQPAPALKGRITFKTEAGDSRPDRGARVIVFPEKRGGTAKLSIVGFRAADATADFQLAAAGLRALGGAVAVVDDDGNFEITLPAAGSYRILVLSHYQPRADDETIEPELKTLLASYFDRPEQLLGKVRHHFGQVRYKGEGTEIWDHSFVRSL